MGVELYGVISDPSVTRAEALEHSREYNVQFPVLFDGSGELRLALAPTHTPQAIVLSPFGTKLYSGAIDDRHVRLGIKKDQATHSYLQDAIQSVIMGQRIAVSTNETDRLFAGRPARQDIDRRGDLRARHLSDHPGPTVPRVTVPADQVRSRC